MLPVDVTLDNDDVHDLIYALEEAMQSFMDRGKNSEEDNAQYERWNALEARLSLLLAG